MRTHHLIKFGAAALLSMTLAACQSTDDMADESSSMEEDMSSTSGGAETMPARMRDGITEEEFQTESAARQTNVFYFEFDKSDLSAEAREALVYHANYLKRHPEVRVRLEGHADERGTREYNLALGERRAQAVERYLQVQGVSSRQLETISYGEERPADPGTTEAAYSRNRRVEMK